MYIKVNCGHLYLNYNKSFMSVDANADQLVGMQISWWGSWGRVPVV